MLDMFHVPHSTIMLLNVFFFTFLPTILFLSLFICMYFVEYGKCPAQKIFCRNSTRYSTKFKLHLYVLVIASFERVCECVCTCCTFPYSCFFLFRNSNLTQNLQVVLRINEILIWNATCNRNVL